MAPGWPLAFSLLLLFPMGASDWPRWRGPAGDGHAPPGTPALARLPSEPRILWQVPAGPGLASPVVSAGVVLVFDTQDGMETLRALDATSGVERWRVPVDEPFTDSQGPTGPRCTPLIDGDRAYAVSCRGELQCRALKDGHRLWQANYGTHFGAVFVGEKGGIPGAARHGNNGSPLVDGDHLIACAGGTNGAGVVCLDKLTGAVAWKSLNDMAGYAPPVVAELAGRRQVIVFTADGLVGLDRREGRELWRVPIKTAFARHVAAPLVRGDLVIAGSHQSGLLGVRVVSEGGNCRVTPVWTSRDGAPNFSSPVLVGDRVYGLGPAKNIVCLNADTGVLDWSEAGLISTSADKAYGSLLVVGANILLLSDTGELMLFAADSTAYRGLGRAQVVGVNWCNPALADGVLYLRDGLKREGSWRAVVVAESKEP